MRVGLFVMDFFCSEITQNVSFFCFCFGDTEPAEKNVVKCGDR